MSRQQRDDLDETLRAAALDLGGDVGEQRIIFAVVGRARVRAARRAGTRLISVEYRLAPENPHPAALADAVAAYRGLLDSGLPPSRIAVAGESAGAGLAAATLVALDDAGLPQPSSALLMSPWADLTLSGDSIAEKALSTPR